MQISTNPISVSGLLLDTDSLPIKSKKFTIEDSNHNLLTSSSTNKKGNFVIKLPAELAKQSIELVFKVTMEKRIKEHAFIKDSLSLMDIFPFIRGPQEIQKVVYPISITSEKLDIGNIEMDTTLENDDFSLGYTKDILSTGLPALFKKAEENVKTKLGCFEDTGIQGIQDDYGIEKIDLTSENIWKFITDGICPLYLKKQGEFLLAEINWDLYEFDKIESLPNVKAFFRQTVSEDPQLERIEVQFRKTLLPSRKETDKEPVIIYISTQNNFEEGLRILGSVFHIYGQTNLHLGIGHSYGAFVAQKIYDYLKGSIFGALLLPHCEHTRTITNQLGYEVIFGKTGVLNCSALSVRGIAWRIHNTIAALDPFSFKPREPITNNHQFAKGQKIFFEALSKGVSRYIEDNWNQIKKEWTSVHKFFYQLYKTSPIYREWEEDYSIMTDWMDSSEIGGYVNPNAPQRSKYKDSDTGVRSIRWVAKDRNGPQGGDKEMITLFAIDFINRETFWHSYIHGSQYLKSRVAPSVTDLGFSPISLENHGQGAFGGIKEVDAIKTEEIIQIFANFPVQNYMLLNSNTVAPQIKEEIAKVSKELLKCDFNAEKELLGSVCI